MLRQESYYSGVPYDDINWYDVVGQPFGTAVNFNAIIFGDANNIVDIKGAMAVGGNFTSARGLSLGYGNDGKLTQTGYSPDLVRFLVGGNIAMQGPLVVIGHVVGGGNFRAGRGSTYMIGKDGTSDQAQRLTDLYRANGGSRYWRLSDRGNHYAVSSYDVPRFIPAERIGADVSGFFDDAYDNISYFHSCISDLQPNGTVTERFHEWILRGDDPVQNVFLIDARPNGLLNKEIRFEIPEGSIAIVNIRTGDNAHLQYGLWGSERLANRTLYVFNDARNIYMEVPAAIWGSILAPQAAFHAHQTGGTVSGNAALGSLMVNSTSGFEFHLYPFVGGVVCEYMEAPVEEEMPMPEPEPEPVPEPEPIPEPEAEPMPIPEPEPEPIPELMPEFEPEPEPEPIPEPEPEPAPEAAPAPEPTPAPRPTPTPRPRPIPIPVPIPRPTPTPAPVPPVQMPQEECPECPECPEQEIHLNIQPVIPVPVPTPQKADCKIAPGLIFGCIWGCACSCNHEWIVKLYRSCGDSKKLLYEQKIGSCGCFEFKVPYNDFYGLEICPVRKSKGQTSCKPMLSLKNVGVANLMLY